MIALQHQEFGLAAKVVRAVHTEPAPAPGSGEVRVSMLLSPVNPSDLLKTEGRYGAANPVLPQGCGVEGIGRVDDIGSDVVHLSKGDLVLLRFGNRPVWAEALTLSADRLFAVEGSDLVQLSMLAANPATAWLMLNKAADLPPGSWIIQNAANSAVGQCVVQIARERMLHTINFVRSPEAAEQLRALGADIVLLDDDPVPDEFTRVAGLGLDAIGGGATARIACHLTDGGRILSYGLLSGRNAEVDPADLIFRRVALEGFWLAPWANDAPRAELEPVYEELARLVEAGKLGMAVEAVYDLEDHAKALEHAARPGRQGKILLRGPAAANTTIHRNCREAS